MPNAHTQSSVVQRRALRHVVRPWWQKAFWCPQTLVRKIRTPASTRSPSLKPSYSEQYKAAPLLQPSWQSALAEKQAHPVWQLFHGTGCLHAKVGQKLQKMETYQERFSDILLGAPPSCWGAQVGEGGRGLSQTPPLCQVSPEDRNEHVP